MTQNSKDSAGEVPTQSHTVTHHLPRARPRALVGKGSGVDGLRGACPAVSRETGPLPRLQPWPRPPQRRFFMMNLLRNSSSSLTRLDIPQRGFLLFFFVVVVFFPPSVFFKIQKSQTSGHQMPRVSGRVLGCCSERRESCQLIRVQRLSCPPPPGDLRPREAGHASQGASLPVGVPCSARGCEVPDAEALSQASAVSGSRWRPRIHP